ncbi:exodeoxyribonuclease VII small subunit [Tractidigestivibacter scatoligenes]|jgi:exodeoxyribonuclease VII small subunit|uniref:exodeoxyribonuclease VII small subunit n=1 Tax=Tractidigestivibacter scatoligenes TaxID=1299998 RepID=UPI002F35B5B0
MTKPDVSQYQSFDQITRRLDDIVGAVRDRDVSLERSLDLFDEAIALGSKAVELVDATDFSPEEKAMLADDGTPGEKAADASESASAPEADASADAKNAAEGGNAS